MRPQTLGEVLGQSHLTADGAPLQAMVAEGRLQSIIFWGPPGVGKTTLARILAEAGSFAFAQLSAVTAGLKDVRSAMASGTTSQPMVLFLDEIHRFNKAQQDALLPAMEDGSVVLIGATTENPSFEINNAVLSRARVFVLKPLVAESIMALLQTAVADQSRGLAGRITVAEDQMQRIAAAADGDARRGLHLLDALAAHLAAQGRASAESKDLDQVTAGGMRRFDKQGEDFYNQISALHKAVRGSDPDGALYWLMRMLDGGCDPLYVGRRLLRMAFEDVGNADPRALGLCNDACAAYERLGSPEGELALAQAAVYMASVPKSNAVYAASKAVAKAIKATGSLEVPKHIRNAPTKLMKDLDYGKGYRYDPDEAGGHAGGQTYLPDELHGQQFYAPTDQGLEQRIAERLARLRGASNA
ncbi:replication-associated recombination protein A [bacterium]|nr:replication-associated recombination protein A [bacterium]